MTLDGIINLDKPTGITSAKALYKVRAITQQRKSGHAGTLDPGAGGVLVLCLGRATKLVERIMDQPKVYRATARLDVTSGSFDADRELVPVPVTAAPSEARVRAALAGFEGVIRQSPPTISAIKIGGVPSYKLERKGRTAELKPRPVQVYWLQLHRYAYPELDFEMCCGRGTYVRALIRDLGVALSTGGCLTSLVRTRIGPFGQADAWTIDALTEGASPADCLIDLDTCRRWLDPEARTIPARPGSGTPETV